MAQIRDPLWMLTRQWQFGEFLGEDAGSPAYIKLSAHRSGFKEWRTKQSPATDPSNPIEEAAGLEPLTEREPFSPHDLSLQVELGQTFEALLRQSLPLHAPEIIEIVRQDYPVKGDEDEKDQAVNRFLSICAQRALDGATLYLEAKALTPQPPATLPARLEARSALQPFKTVVIQALAKLIEWVEEVFGVLSATNQATPVAWLPERLEYGIEVIADAPLGGQLTFSADPGRDGELDWRSFDLKSQTPPVAAPAASTVCVMPTHVQFRGMPNARWWDFEENTVNFGAITPDKTDLAKLVVADFMFLHGTDWFVIPYELAMGSLCRIDFLLVRDVFGGLTLVERADAPFIQLGERWTMFSTTAHASETGLADYFILPPSVFTVKQTGPTLEEVRFIRDEMANLAWAIEHTIENRIGEPQPGYEGNVAARSAVPAQPTPAPVDASKPPLRYQIQTEFQTHWFPLLAVRINQATGDIALELGAMRNQSNNQIEPRGKLLNLAPCPYRIREEEVQRDGTRVLRVANRTRLSDGSTRLWIAREKTVGQGEGSSGLRFDLAITNS